MASEARFFATDYRRPLRHPVTYRTTGEHRTLGDLCIDILNISVHGFMSTSDARLGRGERIILRLPHIGRIEAHLAWIVDAHSGFQFERLIRPDDFRIVMEAIQPNPRLRRSR